LISKLFPAVTNAEQPVGSVTPRIAIIGAGAGGSSSAFWISKAKERFGVDVEIDVYDSNGYIGGRSTIVYPYDNSSLPELELGASIFVEANKNLWRASDELI
jgi:prenylcysteine oxidase/farnesylcysteine lyase